MNEKDRKEIQAYDNLIQYEIDQENKYRKLGQRYGSAWFTDMVLCQDEFERRLDNNEQPENFIPEMYKDGYEMTVFEGELDYNPNYPHLEEKYASAVHIAFVFDIDLTDANEKERDGDKFGSQPNDINLDICGLLSKWCEVPHPDNKLTINHLTEGLTNWGYEYNEISEAIAQIRSLDF